MSERVYLGLVQDLSGLLEEARRSSARAVNFVMTATYWEMGRRIVEFEQSGSGRAAYGTELLARLARDLARRFGRGFSRPNLQRFREFYLHFPEKRICSTLSSKLGESAAGHRFPLPWSHYVLLLSRSRSPEALAFYLAEALRGGWSVRQLNRQIATRFYERTALSKNKTAMLTRGAESRADDGVRADDELRDPLVLEFLDLKDEYSESDLEEALVRHLESFLMELGGDFAFVGRQRRLRIGNSWYRVDLLFFHRRLRSLVVIDLKIGEFTPADAGQMNVYLNYAREHWTQPGENPPVGLILTMEKDEALARYALEGLQNSVLAREYRLVLPDEKWLAKRSRRRESAGKGAHGRGSSGSGRRRTRLHPRQRSFGGGQDPRGGARAPSRGASARARRGTDLRRSSASTAHRRRVVSHRPPVFSPTPSRSWRSSRGLPEPLCATRLSPPPRSPYTSTFGTRRAR